MSTDTISRQTGFIHEAALYDSEGGLLDIVIPFLEEAVQAGDPAVAALDERGNELVRAALREQAGVLFVDGLAQHKRPANTIAAYRELFSEQVALGARQIRVVGSVPQPATRALWEWWARYEAAINRLYEEFPVWGICPYDTRFTPERVLDEVTQTHPFLASAGLHAPNPMVETPETFLTRARRTSPDPLEQTSPTVELVDPSPASGAAGRTRHRTCRTPRSRRRRRPRARGQRSRHERDLSWDQTHPCPSVGGARPHRGGRQRSGRWAPRTRLSASFLPRTPSLPAWACGWRTSSATTSPSRPAPTATRFGSSWATHIWTCELTPIRSRWRRSSACHQPPACSIVRIGTLPSRPGRVDDAVQYATRAHQARRPENAEFPPLRVATRTRGEVGYPSSTAPSHDPGALG